MHVVAEHAPWHQHLGYMQAQLVDQSALQQGLHCHRSGQHSRADRTLVTKFVEQVCTESDAGPLAQAGGLISTLN